MQPYVKEGIAAGQVSPEVASAWCPHDANPTSGELYWWLYITYLFKYYDMVDTVQRFQCCISLTAGVAGTVGA